MQDKDKYDTVIPILEDLRSLIKNNLEYDQDHPDEHGAFISGYFNFYLASAYFQAGRLEDSIDYYEKTKTFFMEGTREQKNSAVFSRLTAFMSYHIMIESCSVIFMPTRIINSQQASVLHLQKSMAIPFS